MNKICPRFQFQTTHSVFVSLEVLAVFRKNISIFMFAPCINSIKALFIQLMHAIIKLQEC